MGTPLCKDGSSETCILEPPAIAISPNSACTADARARSGKHCNSDLNRMRQRITVLTAILTPSKNNNSMNSVHNKSNSNGNTNSDSNSSSDSDCNSHTANDGDIAIAQVTMALIKSEMLLLHTGSLTGEGVQGPGMRGDCKRTDDRDPIRKLAFRS